MRQTDIAKAMIVALLAFPMPGVTESPLSAIDWLNNPIFAPRSDVRNLTETEAPAATGVKTPEVTVTTIGGPQKDALGLLPPAQTGLPASLWQNSLTDDLVTRFDALPDHMYPALRAQVYTLLLAEANPPADSTSAAIFLRKRIAALRDLGAVFPAETMLSNVARDNPALFADWFDLALLTEDENDSCKVLITKPYISSDLSARTFCQARTGDWMTAALTLDTGEALNQISEIDVQLLAFFLDPALIDEAPMPPAPDDVTPLQFRLFEAAGAPLSSATLPREFAVADLRETSGWKARLGAAERLARTGALPANHLLGLYTEQRAAASGGVWDRVRAVHALDKALSAQDSKSAAKALNKATALMESADLITPFASMFAHRLDPASIDPHGHKAALQTILLSPYYESGATRFSPQDEDVTFWISLAAGDPRPPSDPTAIETAITDAFHTFDIKPEVKALLEDGKIGEAILEVILDASEAGTHRARDFGRALSSLRALGLESVARQLALEVLLLDDGT